MAKFLMGGSFFLLAASFMACKPLVRQSVSDLTAISDENLTLGIVAITHSNGTHAYRMLLCKKAEVYPPSMLADDSHCRVALHDRSGAEIAFLPNDFRRDFGTKYKGYAKKATIFTLAIVPFALVGLNAGMWRHVKKMKAVEKGDIKFGGKGLSGDFTGDLIDKGLGDSGYLYYSKAYDFHFSQLEVIDDKGIIKLSNPLHPAIYELGSAARLKVMTDNKKLLAELSNLAPDARKVRLDKLEEEVKALNNGVLNDGPESFLREFDAVQYNIHRLMGGMDEIPVPEGGLPSVTKELEDASKAYKEGILRKEEILVKMEILEKSNNLEQLAKNTDEDLLELKEELLDQDAKSLRGYLEKARLEKFAKRDTKIGAIGGAGLATAILLAIDKSIWGYADRQVSKHWHQIFVENDDFNDTRQVNDVRLILQVLADRFGFFVSQKALQLAP